MKDKNELTKSLKSGILRLPDGYQIPLHDHKTSFKSVRTENYRGKQIRIETTYKIFIDKEPLSSHTTVMNDGTVHCHDFPNYSFSSAIDMVRKIIDSIMEFQEPDDELSSKQNTHDGGHH